MKVEPPLLLPSTVLAASPRHASCELEGETVILSLDSGTYYGLDGVGKRVWELVQEPHTIEELVAVIREEYDVSPDRCLYDIKQLAEHMISAGLLEVRSS